MAAVSGDIDVGFAVKRYLFGSHMPVISCVAGAAIREGDLVINSSGRVIKATDDAKLEFVGLATEAASAAGDVLSVVPAIPGVVFEATLEDDGTAGHTLAASEADVFIQYAVKVDPAGSALHFIDQNDTSDISVVILAYVDPAATVRGRVECMFLASTTVFGA